METSLRSQTPSLTLLEHQAEEFNFYQAIRLLEAALREQNQGQRIQFNALNVQSFAPNFIAEISNDAANNKVDVDVNGFTLAGHQGPLPEVFTELFQQYSAQGNEGPQAFLNLFNNRLLQLLYDSKKQLDPMLFNESAENSIVYDLLKSLIGLTTADILYFKRLHISAEELLSFATLLIGGKQNYSTLKQVLEVVFDCEVEVDTCVGAWRDLPQRYQTRLLPGQAQLGSGIGLGTKYWDNQACIGLTINVSSKEACKELMLGGKRNQALASLATYLTDGKYQIYVLIKLDWEDIPPSELKRDNPMYLGETAWLKNEAKLDRVVHEADFVIDPDLSHKFAGAAA